MSCSKKIRTHAYFAYNKALTSNVKTGRHCAILLDEKYNKIDYFVNISCGRNSIHSEKGLIDKIKSENSTFDFSNCKIIVIRGNFLGKLTMSKPCKNCYDSIVNSGIKTIIYSSGHNKFEIITI